MASEQSAQPSTSPPPKDPSALFPLLEQTLSTPTLAPRWHLLALSALVGGTEPLLAANLYTYLISKPEYQTPASRQALIRSMREALVKLVSIIGVCKPLEAILAIAQLERPEDRDFSFSREKWANDEANHDRGMDWLEKIYTRNTEKTLSLFDAHKDFRWISTEITYGLYLSDRQVLDDVDTEVVVLAGIMIQNLPLETAWHIRGSRRIGMSLEEVKGVMEGVRRVGEFMGTRLDRIPRAEDVEGEV